MYFQILLSQTSIKMWKSADIMGILIDILRIEMWNLKFTYLLNIFYLFIYLINKSIKLVILEIR